jgi:hypothetical protein
VHYGAYPGGLSQSLLTAVLVYGIFHPLTEFFSSFNFAPAYMPCFTTFVLYQSQF